MMYRTGIAAKAVSFGSRTGDQLLDCIALVNNALGFLVLCQLQVRVDPEILRMEPEVWPGRFFAAYALEDASVAVFDVITSCHMPSIEKMCEGMWSVRRRGCDGRIMPRGEQRALPGARSRSCG